MTSNFSDDSLLSATTERESISTAMDCLNLFCKTSRAIVNEYKTNYWVVDLHDPPTWIPTT